MFEMVKQLIERLLNHEIKTRWIVLAVLITVLFIVRNGEVYDSVGGEPNWSENGDEKSMRIESDIHLKGGQSSICQQVVVKYKGVIFMIINVKGVYCTNTVRLKNEEEKSFFEWEYSPDARDKLENFRNVIYKMIKEEGEQLAIQQAPFCECELEWVAEVRYQNLKRNRERKRQLLYLSGMVERIPDKEVLYRNSQYWLNIKNFEKNEDIEQNREIVDWICGCLQDIKHFKSIPGN